MPITGRAFRWISSGRSHPDAYVFNLYDDQKQLNCLVLSVPTAEIDLTNRTLPLRDLENDRLIAVDLQTGTAAL